MLVLMYAAWCDICHGESNSTESLPIRSNGGKVYFSIQNILKSEVWNSCLWCSNHFFVGCPYLIESWQRHTDSNTFLNCTKAVIFFLNHQPQNRSIFIFTVCIYLHIIQWDIRCCVVYAELFLKLAECMHDRKGLVSFDLLLEGTVRPHLSYIKSHAFSFLTSVVVCQQDCESGWWYHGSRSNFDCHEGP